MNRADFPSAQKTKKDMSNQQESFEEKLSALNETPDTTQEFDPQDIEKNKVMAIIALVCGLAFLAWFVIGIVNAAKGRAKELPLIGHFKILK